MQRRAASAASAKQSRQKPGIGSRYLPLPWPAAQYRLRMLDVLWRHTRMLRDGEQQRLITRHMVEHACQERGLGSGLANHFGPDAGGGEKGSQALGLARHETKRLNREIFSDFAGDTRAFRHPRLPFRNVSPLGFY